MSMRAGDWKCPKCATVNFASRDECRNRCAGVKRNGSGGGGGGGGTAPASKVAPAPKPGDWQCPCGSNNFASRSACFGCQKPRAVPGSQPTSGTCAVSDPSTTVMSGDWMCQCGMNNFASRAACFKCRQPRGAPQQQQQQQQPSAQQATQPSSGVAVPSTVVMSGDWMCQCGTNNFASRSVCFKCQNSKDAPQSSTPSQPSSTASGTCAVSNPSTTVMSGDWMCQCGTNNFASRAACFKCRQPRAGGVSSQAGATTPASAPSAVAKPGDWTCRQCSFSNFGSRVACFQCGAPRPAPAVAGGGAITTTTPSRLDGSDAAILGTFALPSYWKSAATRMKPNLVESGYFADVASTLWSKFATATKGRQITKVVRIENVALWHGYCAEVNRLVSKYPNQAAPIPPKWEPKTLQILPDTFHINESYLCHGTSPAIAQLIVEGGFDPSFSGESAGSLFGQGTYFSDSLDKVMGYSKGCIVVARVALGEVAVPPHSGTPSSYRRPPVKANSTDEYDSLVATASPNKPLKEFVVYRHTKAYPEYLIFHD